MMVSPEYGGGGMDERRIPPTSMKHKGDHVLFDIADDKGMFSRRKDDSVSRVER